MPASAGCSSSEIAPRCDWRRKWSARRFRAIAMIHVRGWRVLGIELAQARTTCSNVVAVRSSAVSCETEYVKNAYTARTLSW